MSNEPHVAAARGAEFLDQRRPGWADEIDLDTLDLRSLDDCVLGQLYGDWGAANRAIPEIEWNSGSQAYYGFELDGAPFSRDRYKALTDEWRDQVLMRRHAEVTV